MKFPIYLDNQATTPVDPAVFKAMEPYFLNVFGNAASRYHEFGWTAEAAVELGREQIAGVIGADPKEVIFTSGATESNNLAIKGVAEAYAEKGRHIVTTPVEHKSVLDTCEYLKTKGFEITYVPVDSTGRVNPEDVNRAIRPDTILVSVIMASNEVGTINPIAEIGRICKDRGVIFHSDGVQAYGKIPIDVQKMDIGLLSFTAHKIYGPKGCGALYVRRKNPRVIVMPQIHGGGHERGLRSGTLNVPGIVGFGKAAELACAKMKEEMARVGSLRDRLWNGIRDLWPDARVNGHPTERLPGNLNVSFEGVEGEALMIGMKELAVSSGSACTSASLEPSYVLRAMGLSEDFAHSSIRFGIGRFNTEAEIDYAIVKVTETARKLRAASAAQIFEETTI